MKLTVLKRINYFIKTAYGALQNFFQNTFLWKIYGMLQGSSEVCPIWSLSSSVEFGVLDEQFPMAVFPSP
jgi:peptidoglycan/LPS O-acetylase OafA/YrhL